MKKTQFTHQNSALIVGTISKGRKSFIILIQDNGSVVGVDPFLFPIAQWNDLRGGLEKSGHRLVTIIVFLASGLSLFLLP